MLWTKTLSFIGDFDLPGIDFPTHMKGNILDLILTNCADKVIEISDTGRLGKSDHCMLKMTLDFQPTSQARQETRYNWSKADYEKMQEDMNRCSMERNPTWRNC